MFKTYDIFEMETVNENNSIPKQIIFDIHFRNKERRSVIYNNVNEDYNGVCVVGNEIFRNNKMIYDNGIYIGDDYALTDLPPVFMITMFPKRHFKNHNIYMSYNSGDDYFYTKTIPVKWRNLTTDDLNKLKKNCLSDKLIAETYMSNNIINVDYVDHKCFVILNNTILLNDVHYEILCSNLIRLKVKPFELPDDDWMNIQVCCDSIIDEDLAKYRITSKLFQLYNDPEVLDVIFEEFKPNFEFEDEDLREYIAENIYPKKYDEDVFRSHMFLTKYFSTEAVFSDNATIYGINWRDSILSEFPEYAFIFDIKDKKKISIYANNLMDITKYPERMIFNDEDDKANFETEMAELLAKPDLTPIDRLDFTNKWMINVYKRDKDTGEILEKVRSYKLPLMPRVVQIPEHRPLNYIMTNHAATVQYLNNRMINHYRGTGDFYNYSSTLEQIRRSKENELREGWRIQPLAKVGPHSRYWDLMRFYHSNRDIILKQSSDAGDHGWFGYSNIWSYWLDHDSALCQGIPINYCAPLRVSVYNDNDLEYMETWPDILEQKEKENIPLDEQDGMMKPDTNQRWIYLIKDMPYDHIPDPERFDYIVDNRSTKVTLRQLIPNIPSDVLCYGFYLDKEKTRFATIGLDEDLKHLDHLKAISSVYDTSGAIPKDIPILIPVYKKYNINIDLGPVKNLDDNTSDGEDRQDVILTFGIPKRRFSPDSIVSKTYPALLKDKITLDELKAELKRNNGIELKDLERYDKRETNSIYLFETNYNLNKNKNEYNRVYKLNGTLPELNSDKIWHYYGTDNISEITSIDGKILRIFDIDTINASLFAKTPPFNLPADYIMRGDNFRFLTEQLANTYDNGGDELRLPLLDYMLAKEWNQSKYNLTPEELANAEQYKAVAKQYEVALSKLNKYILKAKDGKSVLDMDLNDIGYNLFTNTLLDRNMELYFTPDKNIMIRTIEPPFKSDRVPIPPYINKYDIFNATLYKYVEGTNRFIYWTSDKNLDDDIDINELDIVTEPNSTIDISDTLLGVSFNLLPDKFKIYEVNRYDDLNTKYIPKIEIDLNDPKCYKKLKELNYNNKRKLYVEYKVEGNMKRLLGVDALLWVLYQKYITTDNAKTINNDFDLYIEFNKDKGSLDLGKFHDHFDKFMKTELTRNVLSNWKNAYGYFKYIPTRSNTTNFTASKFVDVVMVHPGVNLEIEIVDQRGTRRLIRNRLDDSVTFRIPGDRNFTNIMTTDINYTLLSTYLTSVSINNFKTRTATVIVYDENRGTKLSIDNVTTLFDALAYAGGTPENSTLRRMPSVPTIRVTYYVTGAHVDSIIETWNEDKWKDYQFGKDNVLGFKVGIGNTIMLKEYDTYFNLK